MNFFWYLLLHLLCFIFTYATKTAFGTTACSIRSNTLSTFTSYLIIIISWEMVADGIKWSEGLDPTINLIAAKATHLLERGEFVVRYMRILSLCSEASQLSIIGFKVRLCQITRVHIEHKA